MTKRQDRDAIYVKRQFDTEIIVLCVRWYITYRLSYRDLVAMMAERGDHFSHDDHAMGDSVCSGI
jgi:transposase-like protein